MKFHMRNDDGINTPDGLIDFEKFPQSNYVFLPSECHELRAEWHSKFEVNLEAPVKVFTDFEKNEYMELSLMDIIEHFKGMDVLQPYPNLFNDELNYAVRDSLRLDSIDFMNKTATFNLGYDARQWLITMQNCCKKASDKAIYRANVLNEMLAADFSDFVKNPMDNMSVSRLGDDLFKAMNNQGLDNDTIREAVKFLSNYLTHCVDVQEELEAKKTMLKNAELLAERDSKSSSIDTEKLQESEAFVEKTFQKFEKNGHSKTFYPSGSDFIDYEGKPYIVLGRLTPEENENIWDGVPMWDIQFEDGTRTSAFPDEIIPSVICENNPKLTLADMQSIAFTEAEKTFFKKEPTKESKPTEPIKPTTSKTEYVK